MMGKEGTYLMKKSDWEKDGELIIWGGSWERSILWLICITWSWQVGR